MAETRGPYREWGLMVRPARERQEAHDTGCPELAKAIRQARRKARLTQADLAQGMPVSRSLVAAWETARRPIFHRDFEALSAMLRPGPYDWKAVEGRVQVSRWDRKVTLPAPGPE